MKNQSNEKIEDNDDEKIFDKAFFKIEFDPNNSNE